MRNCIKLVENEIDAVISGCICYSTAARNNLSTEELVTTLGSGVSTLPKHAVQVIRHMWNEQGKAIAVSEDAGNMATVGQVTKGQSTAELMMNISEMSVSLCVSCCQAGSGSWLLKAFLPVCKFTCCQVPTQIKQHIQ